jgi:hypothetical protein
MIEGLSFPLLLPTGFGLCAFAMWIAMLFMHRPKAQFHFGEEAIVLKVTNAKILRIDRTNDEVIVHVDREVAQVIEALAA